MHSFKKLYRFKTSHLVSIPVRNSNNYNKFSDLLPSRDQLKMELQMKADAAQAKFSSFFKFYEQFTGLSDVRIAQQRVLDAQEQFLKVQNKRREVFNLLTDVQLKRKQVQEKLQLSKPGEPTYLKLIMEDHEIIGQENKLKESFIDIEKLERELFTNLTTAVRISHERERLQADKTKYWSIIGSIIGTIIGIIGSSINNSYRLKEIKAILSDISYVTKHSSDTSSEKLKLIENLVKQTYTNGIAKPIIRTFSTQTPLTESKFLNKDLETDGLKKHFLIGFIGAITLFCACCCRQ